MSEVLFWIYLANAILIINHEIDSAYWKEWDLFKLPGGISGFLIIHFPLLFLILYGLILVHQGSFSGLIISLLLSLSGVFAFSIHLFFIKKGRDEFKSPVSLFILVATLIVSVVQGSLTIVLMLHWIEQLNLLRRLFRGHLLRPGWVSVFGVLLLRWHQKLYRVSRLIKG